MCSSDLGIRCRLSRRRLSVWLIGPGISGRGGLLFFWFRRRTFGRRFGSWLDCRGVWNFASLRGRGLRRLRLLGLVTGSLGENVRGSSAPHKTGQKEAHQAPKAFFRCCLRCRSPHRRHRLSRNRFRLRQTEWNIRHLHYLRCPDFRCMEPFCLVHPNFQD